MAIQKKTIKYQYKITPASPQALAVYADLGWRLIAVDSGNMYFEMEV